MAHRKSTASPSGQTNLFDLFAGQPQALVVSVPAPPAAAADPPPGPVLPDGWSLDDIRFLLNILEEGPLLVADGKLGIPTIHSNFGAEVIHAGYGLMVVEGTDYKLDFDAGGAMARTPSGKGWTRLRIEGSYPYDKAAVRNTLRSYLPEEENREPPCSASGEDEAESRPAECPPAGRSLEEQAREFSRALGQFIGTEQWLRYPTPCPHIVLLTDGARFVAEHGGEDGSSAWWLIDVIASYQGEAAMRRHGFQVWKLIIHPPDRPGPEQNSVMATVEGKANDEKEFNPHRHATVICTNGNEKELVRQEIEMTDFLPVGEVRLYASVEQHPDISMQKKVMIILLDSEY
jgi:hypothetical protein